MSTYSKHFACEYCIVNHACLFFYSYWTVWAQLRGLVRNTTWVQWLLIEFCTCLNPNRLLYISLLKLPVVKCKVHHKSTPWFDLFEVHCSTEISIKWKQKKGLKAQCLPGCWVNHKNHFWVPTQKLPATAFFPGGFLLVAEDSAGDIRPKCQQHRSASAITSHKHKTGNWQVKMYLLPVGKCPHPLHDMATFTVLWWMKMMIRLMSPQHF